METWVGLVLHGGLSADWEGNILALVLGNYRSSERMVVFLMQRIGWARFKWLCWGSGFDPKRTLIERKPIRGLKN